MSKARLGIILVIVLTFIAGMPLYAEAFSVEGEATVDIRWKGGYIEATGQAVPPDHATHEGQRKLLAREGAITMARVRMLERLEGVRIEGETTLYDMMGSQRVYEEVEGFVQGAYVLEETENWDQEMEIFEVSLRKPMDDMYKIIYREKEDKFSTTPARRTTDYTGLVIDATGLDLTPQAMFKVLDEDGRTIYSAAKAKYMAAVDGGVVGYSDKVQAAKDDPRTCENPMVVEAIDTSGRYDTDLVVSRRDGQRIEENLDKTEVFREARVIVVAD